MSRTEKINYPIQNQIILNNISKKIKAIRTARKETLSQLGSAIDISRYQVSDYERGKARIHLHQLYKLARHYLVLIDWFFEDIEPRIKKAEIDLYCISLPKTTDIQKAVGQRLRYLRRMNSETTRNVGETIGISGSLYRNIEQGNKALTVDKLYILCLLYGVYPRYFFLDLECK